MEWHIFRAVEEAILEVVGRNGVAFWVQLQVAREIIIQHYSDFALTTPIASSLPFHDEGLRWAYAYQHVSAHAHMVNDILGKFMASIPKFMTWCSQLGGRGVRVCCVGGGPGSDLLGFAIFIRYHSLNVALIQGDVLDQWMAWEGTFWTILKHLSQQRCVQLPVGISVNYRDFNFHDLLHPTSWESVQRVRTADLITMVKFVSAVAADAVQCEKTLTIILRLMNDGALFFFLDNSGGGYTNIVCRAAKSAGLNQLGKIEHDDITLPMHEREAIASSNLPLKKIHSQKQWKISAFLWQKGNTPGPTTHSHAMNQVLNPNVPPHNAICTANPYPHLHEPIPIRYFPPQTFNVVHPHLFQPIIRSPLPTPAIHIPGNSARCQVQSSQPNIAQQPPKSKPCNKRLQTKTSRKSGQSSPANSSATQSPKSAPKVHQGGTPKSDNTEDQPTTLEEYVDHLGISELLEISLLSTEEQPRTAQVDIKHPSGTSEETILVEPNLVTSTTKSNQSPKREPLNLATNSGWTKVTRKNKKSKQTLNSQLSSSAENLAMKSDPARNNASTSTSHCSPQNISASTLDVTTEKEFKNASTMTCSLGAINQTQSTQTTLSFASILIELLELCSQNQNAEGTTKVPKILETNLPAQSIPFDVLLGHIHELWNLSQNHKDITSASKELRTLLTSDLKTIPTSQSLESVCARDETKQKSANRTSVSKEGHVTATPTEKSTQYTPVSQLNSTPAKNQDKTNVAHEIIPVACTNYISEITHVSNETSATSPEISTSSKDTLLRDIICKNKETQIDAVMLNLPASNLCQNDDAILNEKKKKTKKRKKKNVQITPPVVNSTLQDSQVTSPTFPDLLLQTSKPLDRMPPSPKTPAKVTPCNTHLPTNGMIQTSHSNQRFSTTSTNFTCLHEKTVEPNKRTTKYGEIIIRKNFPPFVGQANAADFPRKPGFTIAFDSDEFWRKKSDKTIISNISCPSFRVGGISLFEIIVRNKARLVTCLTL